jgi:hypothetical protein
MSSSAQEQEIESAEISKSSAVDKNTSRKAAPKKKAVKKKSKKSVTSDDPDRKGRRTTLFPASSFEEALTIPNAIQKHAAGQQVRRLTLFDQLSKSPDSGPSRQLITNASKYGLIKGNPKAEYLELTADGKIATSQDVSLREKLPVMFRLSIESVPPFKALYDGLRGNRVPATSVLEDMAKEKGVPPEDAKECVEVFVVNAKFLGILKPIAGAERIIPIEQAIEDCPATATANAVAQSAESAAVRPIVQVNHASWDYGSICFYISPIGSEDTEERAHSDLFLGSLVEPALEEFGLKVVRADKIGKPGMITSQIVEHIVKSKLVVADLSFHNPNVFYELCLRHVCRLPTVQK